MGFYLIGIHLFLAPRKLLLCFLARLSCDSLLGAEVSFDVRLLSCSKSKASFSFSKNCICSSVSGLNSLKNLSISIPFSLPSAYRSSICCFKLSRINFASSIVFSVSDRIRLNSEREPDSDCLPCVQRGNAMVCCASLTRRRAPYIISRLV